MVRRPSLLRPGSTAPAVEPMRRRHLRSVMEIERKVYPRGWSLNVFQTEVALARKGERYYVVARLDGVVVGYGGLLFSGDDAHVTNIAVDPAFQRRRLGSLLLTDLAREGIRRGSKNLTLEVRVSNDAAQSLYRMFGFVPAGVRKNYYENVEDALVMWCNDIDSTEYCELLERLEVRA
jgi:ribosomal-protein-alanine N-acetyltransferase